LPSPDHRRVARVRSPDARGHAALHAEPRERAATRREGLNLENPVFYRYEDAQGRIVIVDSLDAIPAAERARAERISYESSPRAPIQALDGARVGVDWPSFAAGFGCALLLGLVLLVFRRTSSPFARLIAFALAAAVIGGSYLGWLRPSTGQS